VGGASSDIEDLDGVFKSMTINVNTHQDIQGNISLYLGTNSKDGNPHLDFTIEYGEQVNRNSYLFHIWLDATLNFQRLDFTGLPLNITVNYVTPLYRKSKEHEGQSQLFRLRNAAHETHMSFLEEWFPTEQTTGNNKAITHNLGKRGYETLSLELKALSDKALMTRDMAFGIALKTGNITTMIAISPAIMYLWSLSDGV
jgi:hypothetical protein